MFVLMMEPRQRIIPGIWPPGSQLELYILHISVLQDPETQTRGVESAASVFGFGFRWGIGCLNHGRAVRLIIEVNLCKSLLLISHKFWCLREL